jgi:hypothetical protein
MKDELLLIPKKVDAERDLLAKTWALNNGEVLRIGKFWIKPETKNKRVTIYGHDTFCLVLAQVLNLGLLMPKDEDIAKIEFEFLKRRIEIISIRNRKDIQFPKFVKSVKPKLFPASIFASIQILNKETKDMEQDELLICSEIVEIKKEVRAFILNKKIADLAYYEGSGELNEAEIFIESFLQKSKVTFPKSYVLDLGWNQKDKWFIIEVNSSWGAGLNSCDPQKVLNCIREATLN